MSLKHTILGYLSWKPMSGYDLKKIFSDTEFIHWSGNNNQIYRTLLELGKEGLVEKETVKQDNYPDKNIYKTTGSGLLELDRWVKSVPKTPSVKNTFMMQLGWSGSLDKNEFMELIGGYRHEIEMLLLMCKEKFARRSNMPSRDKREQYIWEMLWQNRIDMYQTELDWLTRLGNGVPND